jgi:hypothetical protein
MTKQAVVVISDLHIGSHQGLCPPTGIRLDEGNQITQTKIQGYVWECFVHFMRTFVPLTIKGCDKVALVVNGDVIDGNHHNATNLVTNVEMQARAAIEILAPYAEMSTQFIMVRGTEAHGGSGEQQTERIAASLKAVQDPDTGAYSWWQYWMEAGSVVHQFAHHISTTSSAAYESSAPMRELAASLVESAQWGQRQPQVVWRSHRHRFIPVAIPSSNGRIECIITPAWQTRTPYVEKIDRLRLSHIGGVIAICEDGSCTIKEKLYEMPKPKVNIL